LSFPAAGDAGGRILTKARIGSTDAGLRSCWSGSASRRTRLAGAVALPDHPLDPRSAAEISAASVAG
jgi:hypothetical protein